MGTDLGGSDVANSEIRAYVRLNGDWDQRFNIAREAVERLLRVGKDGAEHQDFHAHPCAGVARSLRALPHVCRSTAQMRSAA